MYHLETPLQINLLKLYEEEIVSRISSGLDSIKNTKLYDLMRSPNLDEILAMDIEDKKKTEKLWAEWIDSPLKSQLYVIILEFLNSVDQDLHSLICVERYNYEFIVGLRKILKCYPEILDKITSLETFSSTLGEHMKGISKILVPIMERVRREQLSEHRAKKLILRIVPTLASSGYEHLLNAISSCSDESREYIKNIYSNFDNEYEYLKYLESRQTGIFYQAQIEDSVESIIASAMKPEETQNIFYAKIGRIPEAHFRSCAVDYCKETPLNLRPYQRELIENSCDGHNTIICAPTGSGKTVVGAYIIRDHVYKALRNKRRYKACFIVPTTSLVQQQETLLRDYLDHCSKIKGLSGDSPTSAPLKSTIEDADIIVITPQLIVNLLKYTPKDGAITEYHQPFDLTTFTMIIFDEVHHARYDDPYNVIMGFYHDLKMSTAYKKDKKLPQIVGMSASLGVGGSASKNLEQAVNYTLDVCASLDASRVDNVRIHTNSLKEYMNDTIEEIIFIGLEEIFDSRFFEILLRQIGHLKALMLQVPDAIKDEVYEKIADKNGNDPLHIAFSNWVHPLKKWLNETNLLGDQSRNELKVYTEQTIYFYNAITMVRIFDAKIAINYIDDCEERFIRNKHGAFVDRLKKTIDELHGSVNDLSNPLFMELLRIITDQFQKDKNSRVIIFLQQREYCARLSELLKANNFDKTSYLTGMQGKEGQNTREQEATIQDFAAGNLNILCATTVAEEGLDISACNLVINYNYITHEIARVQRRGRARAKNARSILLTCDKWIKEKEEQNRLREILMNEALEVVGKYNKKDLQLKINKLIDNLNTKRIEKRNLDAIEKQRRRDLTKDHDYFILCGKCEAVIGNSTQMFIASQSQYVLCNKDFWSKVSVNELPEDKKEHKMTKLASPIVGDIYCANVQTHGPAAGKCTNWIGRVVKVRSVFLPTPNLKTGGIVFVKSQSKGQKVLPENGERIIKKKWKDVSTTLFCPEQISSLILSQMKEAENAPEILDDVAGQDIDV